MAGDTYQAPAFGWLHAGRTAGLAALTLPETLATGSSKARLIDGMGQRRTVWNASGDKSIRINRGIAVREPITRLYLPAGHNLAGHRMYLMSDVDGTWATPATVLPYASLRGASVVTGPPTIRPGVNVFDVPAMQGRWPGVYLIGRSTNVPELGEVYLTRMWQPSVGHDASRSQSNQAIVALTRLPSGVTYANERGGRARSFEFDTEVLAGADRLLYDRQLEEVGVFRDTFLFDPTTGGYETVVDDFEASAANWTASAGITSLTDVPGVVYAGTNSLRVICSGAANAVLFRTFPSMDLRGCVLGLSFYTTNFGSWASASDGVRVYLRNSLSAGFSAYWAFGTTYVTVNNTWFKLWIDLDSQAPTSAGSSSVDFASVATVQIELTNGANTPTFYLDDLRVVRKSLAPAMVRVMDAVPVRQRAQNPYGSGEYYSLRYQLDEQLA